MSASILATKLYVPPPRTHTVRRSRLVARLNETLAAGGKLTLISAPAGFGKTTLASEWLADCARPVAWLSLDEGDSDLQRFLTYLAAALQTVAPGIGKGMLAALQGSPLPSLESLLTLLLNELAALSEAFILVLDDFHAVESRPVEEAVAFLLEHLPGPMHLAIATREDPNLSLARLRAQGQLAELRAADLRFTPAETAEFLNHVMRLNLAEESIAALESRTEGWIAGLQLAAISMHGHPDPARFITSFTGSHQFVMDYLLEEVLHQQPGDIQEFLLQTSILDTLNGDLCDAVFGCPQGHGQRILESLANANLFLIPLDSERRWYRYHHLFADLLRQRLGLSAGGKRPAEAELHIRASQWYEDHALEMEAFKHAAAANDIDRAERLVEETKLPIHIPGAVAMVLHWLGSLPAGVKNCRPWLWVKHAQLSLVTGQTLGVEEWLNAGETALRTAELNGKNRNLLGEIAAARATLALTRYQVNSIIEHAQRALEFLSPESLSARMTAIWALGVASHMRGDRSAAGRAYTEVVSISRHTGNVFFITLAAIGLAEVQESNNQLYPAAEAFQRVLQQIGDHPAPYANDAHLGLARIFYEWNDLDAAEEHGRRSLHRPGFTTR